MRLDLFPTLPPPPPGFDPGVGGGVGGKSRASFILLQLVAVPSADRGSKSFGALLTRVVDAVQRAERLSARWTQLGKLPCTKVSGGV